MPPKPTPKGRFEVEVRPSYNNPRKLKKVLDRWFKPGEYEVKPYRDRWIIQTTRKLTDTEINEINKPRDEALAAKGKPRANFKLAKNVISFLRGIGGFKNDAEDTTGVKTAEGSENTKESGTNASTKAKR